MANTLMQGSKAAVVALMAVHAATAVPHAAAAAQQIVEIDYSSGRDLIDNRWRSIELDPQWMALNHDLGTFYVLDSEEPTGVMAFSLDDGEWVRTFHVPMGDGPGELPKRWSGVAAAPDGGLFVAGVKKVIEYDSAARYVSTWLPGPTFPSNTGVCAWDGQPAVPVHSAVFRRTPDGGGKGLGPQFNADRPYGTVTSEDELTDRWGRVLLASVACTREAAYVIYDAGVDSVAVFSISGEETHLDIPTEVVGPRTNTRRLEPSIDNRGNLVLSSTDRSFPGAILKTDGSCHAVIQNRERESQKAFVHVYADSALVFHRVTEVRNVDGREVHVLYAEADRVSLHPFRHVSGERCPGILPSLDEGQGSLDDPAALDAPAERPSTGERRPVTR